MRLRFRNGGQKSLVFKAVEKAGSERKLARLLGLPAGSIYRYKMEIDCLPIETAKKLAHFLGIREKAAFRECAFLDDSWGRKKGGINCVKSKKRNGTFESNLRKAQASAGRKLKAWHKRMRAETPEKYFELQYAHFKKIGGYKFKTQNGELVRNLLEKQVADFLFENDIAYQYEALTRGQKGYYFPDFLIGNLVLECTEWRGYEKAWQLQSKISDLEGVGFDVLVFVPPKVQSYYKTIKPNVIGTFSELKVHLMPR